MTAEQFKNLCWRELGRLTKPDGCHVTLEIQYSQKHGEDWLTVNVTWWTNRSSRVTPEKFIAGRCVRLSDVPEPTLLADLVHTLCDDLRGDIEAKNKQIETLRESGLI